MRSSTGQARPHAQRLDNGEMTPKKEAVSRHTISAPPPLT
jgi:hypothetical protein